MNILKITENKIKLSVFVCAGVIASFLGFIFVWISQNGIEDELTMYTINKSMDLLSLIVTLILIYSFGKGVLIGEQLHRSQIVFVLLNTCNAIGLFTDYFAWELQGKPEFALGNYITNFFFYANGPLSLFVFWNYVKNMIFTEHLRGKHFFTVCQYIIFSISELAIIMNIFLGFYFTVNNEGVYERTEGSFLYYAVPNVVSIIVTIIAITISSERKRDKAILIFYGIVPVAASVLQLFTFGLSVSFCISTCVMLVLYTEVQEKLLSSYMGMKMQMAHSQMQPHFMYNGMSSIRSLIRKSPEDAIQMLNYFMGYTRNALDMSAENGLIPVEKELAFVKDYLEIEHLRFGDKVQFEIQQDCEGFQIPPLTIQPIVENAVRHGIRKKTSGSGTVKIHVFQQDKMNIVRIEDDGVGFDQKEQKKSDGHIHFGVTNTKKRLFFLLDAIMNIQSEPGKGTVVEFLIPQK